MAKRNSFFGRRKKDDEIEPLSNKGSLKEERALREGMGKHRIDGVVDDDKPNSDWLIRIRELRRAEMFRFFRYASNPSLSYLLYHDGEFQGHYSTLRPLSSAGILFNEYLVYEVDAQRKQYQFYFTAVPCLDDKQRLIDHIEVHVHVDIDQPQMLIDKGIYHIEKTMKDRISRIVRTQSARYPASAQSECEARIYQALEAEEFDFGISVTEIFVLREIPSWVAVDRETEEKRQADKERHDREREKARIQREREQARAKREAERKKMMEMDARERQRYYAQLANQPEGINQLRLMAAAEEDEDRRTQLLVFIEEHQDQEERDFERHQKAIQSDFERRKEAMELLHGQRQEQLELLADNDLLSPPFMQDDHNSRGAIHDILRATIVNSGVEDIVTSSREVSENRHLQLDGGNDNFRQLGAGTKNLDDDDEFDDDDLDDLDGDEAREEEDLDRMKDEAINGDYEEVNTGKPTDYDDVEDDPID